ncbi:MAG: DUF1351 domain-containing protein [Candidatus Saccharibacteria bacterium]|nr:DUF1351 domain-containing protein [Moraxellaceae bacterium]
MNTEKTVNQVAEYEPLKAAITDLTTKFKGLVYDVTIPEQYDNAVVERAAFVKLDNKIDTVRKKIKEEPFELCKQIDAQAKMIREPLSARINELTALIKCQDEAQAIKNASFERMIADIRAKPMQLAGQSVDDMQEAHNWIINHDTEQFEGYSIAAENAIKEALAQLEPMIAAQANAEKLAAEQAKQQKALDGRQAAIDKAEREQQEKANEAKHLADLEQARLDGIAQAQRDNQQAIEQAERDAQAKIERAERERIVAEALKPDQDKLAQWLQSCIDSAPTLNDATMQNTINAIVNNFNQKIGQLSSKAA